MSTQTKPLYREGEIVLVRHQDNQTMPINEYIGYIRETVDGSNSEKIPLINVIGYQLSLNSRSRFRILGFRLGGLTNVLKLKRGEEVKSLEIGGLYEIEYHDSDSGGPLPGEDNDVSYKMVGCYAGIKPSSMHDFHMFTNVCQTDSEKLNPKSKDTTLGRRVFNRVRPTGILKITQLKRR